MKEAELLLFFCPVLLRLRSHIFLWRIINLLFITRRGASPGLFVPHQLANLICDCFLFFLVSVFRCPKCMNYDSALESPGVVSEKGASVMAAYSNVDSKS